MLFSSHISLIEKLTKICEHILKICDCRSKFKTNVKRKKKEKYFIRLNILRNLSVKSNVINAIFN